MKLYSSHDFTGSAINGLIPIAEAEALILGGVALALAGPEHVLDTLPMGEWIGGTTPYFMTEQGGCIVRDDMVFATDLSVLGDVTIASYNENELANISAKGPDNGFSLTIIPGLSACHQRFALEAGQYPEAFLRPTVGWVAGWDLEDPHGTAKVYDGKTQAKLSNRAVVAHVSLAEDKLAMLEIVNLFAPDDGDCFQFEESSFAPKYCIVDGARVNFADYVAERGRENGTLPLVGDFGGASVNVSIKSFDAPNRAVTLYAPVFSGVDYHFARPVGDYAASFREAIAKNPQDGAVWSCNCILNFLFGELEGKAIGGMAGPVTFGEIAYQLLNQTMVIVRLK